MTDALTTRTGRARQSLKLEDWPDADRRAWLAANRTGDVIEPGGAGAHWSDCTRNNIAISYGRFLAWLARNGGLDGSRPLAERATRETIDAYIDHLRTRYASMTVVAFLTSLLSALRVMAPRHDWSALQQSINALKRVAEPARDKRSRIVDSDELRDFGEELMEAAENRTTDTSWRRPVQYRNGLIIALLASRALRRANFCATEIGRNLVRHGNGYRLRFEIPETKNHAFVELPFPAGHLPHLERYLAFYRPWLCGLTGHRNPAYPFREPGNRLWVAKTGAAMSEEVFYKNITRLTKARFGHPINPHLFRDCLATSIAIHDPHNVHITRVLLGHKISTTAEKFYNLAGSVEAGRRLQDVITELRHQPDRCDGDDETDDSED